jgi:microcystin-dependent protein
MPIDPYIGQLMPISWNYPPKGWAFCNGQTLAINQNQALFSLLGTTYGGNGQTTFQLPNLQGRIPIGFGNGFTQGQAAGETAHTVSISELPQHAHQLNASNVSANLLPKPNGNSPGAPTGSPPRSLYGPAQNLVAMISQSISNVGSSQPHENEQPYLVINWVIALQGIFPSRN